MSSELYSELRLNKEAFSVVSLSDSDSDHYWWSRSAHERLEAIEINRRIVYGYGNNPPRFQRFFEVVRRGEG